MRDILTDFQRKNQQNIMSIKPLFNVYLMSLPEDVMTKALDIALSSGSSYAEVRYQVDAVRFVNVRNGVLQSLSSYSYGGVSVRVLVDGMWGFAATSNTDWESVRDAVGRAVSLARSVARLRRRKVSISRERLARITYDVSQRVRVEDLSNEYLIKYLSELDAHARVEPRIRVRNLYLSTTITEKLIITSDGGLR